MYGRKKPESLKYHVLKHSKDRSISLQVLSERIETTEEKLLKVLDRNEENPFYLIPGGMIMKIANGLGMNVRPFVNAMWARYLWHAEDIEKKSG